MNSSAIIKTQNFSAHYEKQGDKIAVFMRGNADMEVIERAKAFLDSLSEAARTGRAKETVFELEELYFMNSSCLALLVRFINGVVDLPAAEQYMVRFRSNPNLRWQNKSLAALRAYAQEVVVVE